VFDEGFERKPARLGVRDALSLPEPRLPPAVGAMSQLNPSQTNRESEPDADGGRAGRAPCRILGPCRLGIAFTRSQGARNSI